MKRLAMDRGKAILLGGEIPGGTLKYRLMAHLVDRCGAFPGDRVADVSAGQSALALASIAHIKGIECRVYVPDTLPEDTVAEILALGAEVRRAPLASVGLVLEELRRDHDRGEIHWLGQNFHPYCLEVYQDLACGVEDCPAALVAGVGTGSTLRSFGVHLRSRRPELKVLAIYSPDIPGLRPKAAVLGPRDLGSVDSLHELFGAALEVVELSRHDLNPDSLTLLGVEGGLSTAAVHWVLDQAGLDNSLGVSVDGRFARVPSASA